MLLFNCWTRHARKFGKLSSGHRTGKGQLSFQSQRRSMPKKVQATIWLCSFHMLARLCSKSFKLGFSHTWIKNFQMYKLDLEKAEESEIKLPRVLDHWETKGILETHLLIPLLDWALSLLLCGSQQTEKFSEMGVSDYLTCLLRKLSCWSRSNN